MTKVKRKAPPHGTEFIQGFPGLCCVQDAGLGLRSNGAPQPGQCVGAKWGWGCWGGCLGSADALGQAGSTSERQVCSACCSVWEDSPPPFWFTSKVKRPLTYQDSGLWTWKKAKRDWRLLKYQVTIFLTLLDAHIWHVGKGLPRKVACGFHGWQPHWTHLLPPTCYSQSPHMTTFWLWFLCSGSEKCSAALPQAFNWELSAAMYFKSAQKFWLKENTLFCRTLGREVKVLAFPDWADGELFCPALQVCEIPPCTRDLLIPENKCWY